MKRLLYEPPKIVEFFEEMPEGQFRYCGPGGEPSGPGHSCWSGSSASGACITGPQVHWWCWNGSKA